MINLPDNFFYLKVDYYGDPSKEITIYSHPKYKEFNVHTRHMVLHERSIKTKFKSFDAAISFASLFAKGQETMEQSTVYAVTQSLLVDGHIQVNFWHSKGDAVEFAKKLIKDNKLTVYILKLESSMTILDPPIEIKEYK